MGFAALALLWEAHRRDSRMLYVLGGLAFGSAVVARIDGIISQLALLAYLVIMLATASPGQRRAGLRRAGLILAGAVPAAVLGLLDLALLSPTYSGNLSAESARWPRPEH